MDIHNPRTPGHQRRLGEPWRSFSRKDKIYSLLAIVAIFVLINVVFSDLTDGWGGEQAPVAETSAAWIAAV